MSRMVNFRVDKELAEAIDDAATDSGVPRSVWLREVVAKHLGFTDAEQAHPARTLTLQESRSKRIVARSKCLHPASAAKQLPFTKVCTICGAQLR